mgnify:CR=1 FL=1
MDGEDVIVHVPKKLRFADPQFVDPLAVGDRVRVDLAAEPVVSEILPRTNFLSRPASGRRGKTQLLAANLDHLVVVLSAREPAWKPATLDRYLVLASIHAVRPFVVLNKVDLEPELPENPAFQPYRDLGLTLCFVSTHTGQGVEALRAGLAGKTVALLGPSGVGKTSLVNALAPGMDLPVGEISEQTQKGRHTTTWVELLRMPDGGALIDSPGIRVLDLSGLEPHELAAHFPEFRDYHQGCRFRDCSHTAEPKCAVKQALAEGQVPESRYDSYVRIYESLESGSG